MKDRTIIRPGGRKPRRQSSNLQNDSDYRKERSKSAVNLGSIARAQGHGESENSSIFRRFKVKKETPAEEQLDIENPILSLVSPLILLVQKTRQSSSQNSSLNLDELLDHAISEIEYYRSINFGMDGVYEAIEETSYGLCCLLDEIVLNTPWGAKSQWSRQGLLIVFHQEAWGGERFYQNLERMCANPSRYLPSIEFYYSAMELGFEGKFRQSADGIRQHQIIKSDTFLLIERYRNLEHIPLSEKWQGSYDRKEALLKIIPQWVIWCTAIGAMVVAYFTFSILLSYQADPVKRRLVGIESQEIETTAPQNLRTLIGNFKPRNDLAQLGSDIYPMLTEAFQSEVRAGKLLIEKKGKNVGVRLTSNSLFSSGSDQLSSEYIDIVKKLGDLLKDEKVRIEITGHSDDIPIRTIRFADNWALSEARAVAVKQIMAQELAGNVQVYARGLANSKDLVPNNNASNRALNRRVEILVKT